jgi:hypothetical protein
MTKKELEREIERLRLEVEVLRVRLACLEAERYMPVIVPMPTQPWYPSYLCPPVYTTSGTEQSITDVMLLVD